MIYPWATLPLNVTVVMVRVSSAAMAPASQGRTRGEGERDFHNPERIPAGDVLPVHESAEDLLVEVEP